MLLEPARIWIYELQSKFSFNKSRNGMIRSRLQVLYSGRVQGVGFRYNTKKTALGYEVTGTVRNLQDGRVELICEGSKEELEAFQIGIRESGVRKFIRQEEASWGTPTGEFRGFEITG